MVIHSLVVNVVPGRVIPVKSGGTEVLVLVIVFVEVTKLPEPARPPLLDARLPSPNERLPLPEEELPISDEGLPSLEEWFSESDERLLVTLGIDVSLEL